MAEINSKWQFSETWVGVSLLSIRCVYEYPCTSCLVFLKSWSSAEFSGGNCVSHRGVPELWGEHSGVQLWGVQAWFLPEPWTGAEPALFTVSLLQQHVQRTLSRRSVFAQMSRCGSSWTTVIISVEVGGGEFMKNCVFLWLNRRQRLSGMWPVPSQLCWFPLWRVQCWFLQILQGLCSVWVQRERGPPGPRPGLPPWDWTLPTVHQQHHRVPVPTLRSRLHWGCQGP